MLRFIGSVVLCLVVGCGAGEDAKPDALVAICGDNVCGGNESCSSCSADCGSCQPVCGDNSCNGGENCTTCAADCGACPPVCGDNRCNGTETCASCAMDCGVCACDPANPNSCSGEQVCVGSTCVDAFGRNYRVSIYEFVVNAQNQMGAAWDALGGAPDPYVEVYLNGVPVLVSAEPQDTFSPTYSDTATVVIPAGSTLSFAGWDGDLSERDWIIGCELSPLTADYLRYGGVICSGTADTGTLGTTLTISIVPN